MTRKTGVMFLGLCAMHGSLLAGPVEYYISPDGNDSGSGRIESPFASLAAARDAIRKIGKKPKNITVYLRGGTYVLDKTLVFDLRDSAPEGSRIRYAAYGDEVPTITSAVPIAGWKKMSFPRVGLPKKARGKVWVAEVAPGSGFKVLYSNGAMLPRARSQGFCPVRSKPGRESAKRLVVPEAFNLRRWDNFKDVEVVIRPTYSWAMNILPVDNVDVASRTVATKVGGTYPLEPQPQWSIDAHGISDTCWFENAVDFLDSPGEWVLDSAKGKLYLWPIDGNAPRNIAIPQCVELIRIEGEPQYGKAVDRVVRGLEFEGIAFTGNDRYTWKDAEASFQHDWSAVDQANAMLRFRCAVDCVVEGCTFIQGATAGIRLDLQASDNRIEGNRFSELGEHGIALCGYGPGTKDVSKHNKILNNRIDHIGQLYWYASGIYVAQSGENLIANNLIHNVPFNGITLSGSRNFNYQHPGYGEGYRSIRWQDIGEQNRKMLQEAYARHIEKTDFFLSFLHARNNTIEGNEIFAAVETMGDGNPIYLSGAGTGNRILKNYIHHILSSGISTAMRPDDLQKQTIFERNIVYKCVYGAVENKQNNDYINNIFACIYPTNVHGRDWKAWAYMIFGRGPNTGSRIQNNIFYAEGGKPRFYYARKNSPMDDSIVDNNLYWCEESPRIAKQQLDALRAAGHDLHSIAANPRFADMENGDFSPASGSPAFDVGFIPIDTASIGLQPPWKKTLVGKDLIRTKIMPPTHYIKQGSSFRVEMECDQPDAVIRYTTDGTEPTERSAVYKTALRFKEPVYLRAKAFKEGSVDLHGAAEFYAVRDEH